jgi:aerobic carbon-monoxide dehydrogenase small subunit
MKIDVTINGEARSIDVSPHRRLLDVLREDVGLTGTKEGCGEGECGACSVHLDGETVNSCLVAIGQCHTRSVKTIEGIATLHNGELVLSAVQRALVTFGGAQCGICTPGIVMCATEILARGLLVNKSEADARETIRQQLAGNICRCTGYQLIVDAVMAAANEVTLSGSSQPQGAK